jgi:hypothetical protein
LGLGETLAVDKATHTVIGVREIWSRGQHVTFTSAGGWKAADPTVPMAYLYKIENGSYVYALVAFSDVHALPDDSAKTIFQNGGPITSGRDREADIKACFSGNLDLPVPTPSPAASS